MSSLGVLAITATLIAAGASAQGMSAQGIYDRGGVSRQDAATIDRASDTAHSIKIADSSKIKERARSRGASSYASAPAERARGASAFDGDWSVLIQTRVGDCAPSFRYGLRIENGEVLNAGGAQVDVDGRVARSGAVRVSVAAGDQAAYGAGRLSQTAGGGTWRGRGSSGACSGTWVAERRE
jgi:hypothetical protein